MSTRNEDHDKSSEETASSEPSEVCPRGLGADRSREDAVDPLLASAVADFTTLLESQQGAVDNEAFCDGLEDSLSPASLQELRRLVWIAKALWHNCHDGLSGNAS